MNKNVAVKGAIITEFINSKDKEMRLSSVQELVKEGNVCDFYFRYKAKEESPNTHIAQRIKKLDLYRKEITTIDEKIYRIMNQYEEPKLR